MEGVYVLPEPATAGWTTRRRRAHICRIGLLRRLAAAWIFLCRWIPVLLVIDLVLQTYLVGWFLFSIILRFSRGSNWRDAPPDAPRNTAIGLAAVFGLFWVLLVSSLATMWIEGWLIYRRGYRPPATAIFEMKRSVQAVVNEEVSLSNIRRGRRPNFCRRCPGSSPLDRTYHAQAEGGRDIGCVPAYDHWCWWLWTPVSLTTRKSYLLSMAYILAFHAVSAGILCWSLLAFSLQHTGYSVVAVGAVLPAVVFWVFAAPMTGKWRHLAFMNSTDREYAQFVEPFRRIGRPARWPMCVRSVDGYYHHVVTDANPWDLGTMGNMRQVFGDHIWEWFFPFWVPRSVRDYGKSEEFDLQFSEAWKSHLDVLSSTPTVELSELQPRQRHQFSSSG